MARLMVGQSIAQARRGAVAAVALLVSVASPALAAPEMAEVPAGTFSMGSTRGELDERPVRRVTLSAYAIDRHEVTQAEYQGCVAAGACRPPRRYVGSVGESLPAVGVSWHDAQAYCRWRGKRLPTEAEWERAARGTDGRTYPWGTGLDCGRANFGNFLGAGPCAGKNPGRILPPGSRPGGASPVNAHDLAGNVWEWVEDVYRGAFVETEGLRAGARVVRGGSCCSYFAMPTTTNRLAFPPEYFDADIGFRCASASAARR